ncbi:MAG: hypothetical protein JSS87_11680 [Acidobacteria bacterium]|nr:hypothetical protein [Acidobacteriota bacterium]
MNYSTKHLTSRISHESLLFCIVFVFSLLVRAVVLVLAWNTPLSPDAQDYLEMTRQLLTGHHFVPYWPPGLPLYLSPIVALGGGTGILRLSMMFFWLLLIYGLYRLTAILDLKRWAWKILLVLSITPVSIHLSIEPLTQLPVAALLVVMLAELLGCIRKAEWREYVTFGITVGAMALIRPSALILSFLVIAPAIHSRKFVKATVSLLIVAAICGSWMLKAHEISGRWVFNTSNARNFWYGNNPSTPYYRTWYFGSHAKPGSLEINLFPTYKQELSELSKLSAFDQQKQFTSLSKQYILQHPGVFLLRTLNRFRCYWAFDTFTSLNLRKYVPNLLVPSLIAECITYLAVVGPAFFCIAAAGACFWKKIESWILIGGVALYAAPYWISMSHPTYHFPVILPIAVAGAVAYNSASDSWKAIRGWTTVLFLLAIQVEWLWMMSRQV